MRRDDPRWQVGAALPIVVCLLTYHPKYSNPEFVETLTDSISRTEKVSNIDFVPFESGSGNRFVAVKEIYSATVTGES